MYNIDTESTNEAELNDTTQTDDLAIDHGGQETNDEVSDDDLLDSLWELDEADDDSDKEDGESIEDLREQLKERNTKIKEQSEMIEKWKRRTKKWKKKARSAQKEQSEYLTKDDMMRMMEEKEYREKLWTPVFKKVKELADSKGISMADANAIFAFNNKDEYEEKAKKYNAKGVHWTFEAQKAEDKRTLDFMKWSVRGQAVLDDRKRNK